MQKSLVIVLAVCLISVHAFVRRDAPAQGGDTNYLESIQKQLVDLSQQIGDSVKKTFNPEDLKKNFNDAINNVSKALDDLKPKADGTKKE